MTKRKRIGGRPLMNPFERLKKNVKVVPETGCWEWQGHRTPKGYGRTDVQGRKEGTHRWAYALYNCVEIPTGMQVCHSCDNPPCCNPAHLRLGTQGDNIRDAAAKSRLLTGDANGARRHPERLARGDANGSRKHPESRKRGSEQKNARVSEADIPAIRSRRKAGETLSAIAKTYGVSLQTIWRISKGESWKHI